MCSSTYLHIWTMEVSWNGGTSKSSILMGFSIINHPFWDTPSIYGNPHINDACIPTFPRSKMQSATRRTASGRSGHGVGFRSECRRATAMGTGNENGNLRVTPKLFAPFFFVIWVYFLFWLFCCGLLEAINGTYLDLFCGDANLGWGMAARLMYSAEDPLAW